MSTCRDRRLAEFVFVVWAFACAGSPPPELRVSVTHEGDEIAITNLGAETWTDIDCELNGTFTYRFDRLPPKGRHAVLLEQFATPDGTRFNPAMKMQRVLITAKAPNGRTGSYAGSWK